VQNLVGAAERVLTGSAFIFPLFSIAISHRQFHHVFCFHSFTLCLDFSGLSCSDYELLNADFENSPRIYANSITFFAFIVSRFVWIFPD
jgi:hypothetical protein